MLCGAEPGAEAVITRLYVPGGVAPNWLCGTLAQPATDIANSASAASEGARRSLRRRTPVTATIMAKAMSRTIEGSNGPAIPAGGPKSGRGPNQEQEVFTVIIVTVAPGPRFAEEGEMEQVIVGC